MIDIEKVIKRLKRYIREMDGQRVYLVTWGEDGRIGKCPWCEQHNRLYLVTGKADGKLSMDFMCAECIHAIKVLKHEVSGDD